MLSLVLLFLAFTPFLITQTIMLRLHISYEMYYYLLSMLLVNIKVLVINFVGVKFVNFKWLCFLTSRELDPNPVV